MYDIQYEASPQVRKKISRLGEPRNLARALNPVEMPDDPASMRAEHVRNRSQTVVRGYDDPHFWGRTDAETEQAGAITSYDRVRYLATVDSDGGHTGSHQPSVYVVPK